MYGVANDDEEEGAQEGEWLEFTKTRSLFNNNTSASQRRKSWTFLPRTD